MMATDDQAILFMNFIHERYETYGINLKNAWQDYKVERMKHASTSPGPVNCDIRITMQGIIRDGAKCKRCGRDDDQGCPFFHPDGSTR
jgi:hypothetical protein